MMAMKRIIIINIFRKHGRIKREIKRSPSSKSGRDTSGNRRCAQQDQGDLRLLKERFYSFVTHFCPVQMTRKVSGVLMVNQEGLPIKTTMDSSTTAIYGGMVIALLFNSF